MSTVVIDLNDHGITAFGPDGAVALRSPAYALQQDDGSILLGEAARQRWRAQPTLINNRFWNDLSLEPLPARGGVVRSHADVACDHLTTIWKRLTDQGANDAILVVPGNYSRHQLSLLLGIARECAMPVAGMIDKAVASATQAQPGRTLMHLDIQLHRTVLTSLSQGERLSRAGVSSAAVGLAALHETWVKKIAAKFVSDTRLDPRHDAAGEQAMFDSLADWLEGAGSGSVRIEIERGGNVHGVGFTLDEITAMVQAEYAKIVRLVSDATAAGERVSLLVSDRVAALPGLGDMLDGLPDCERVALAATVTASGALGHAATIRADGNQASFVTHVPWLAGAAPAVAPQSAPDGPAPTHVLLDGIAHPVNGIALCIGSDTGGESRGITLTDRLGGVSRKHCRIVADGGVVTVEDASTYGTFLNGQKVSGRAPLGVGDRLRIGTPGHEIMLIRVQAD